MTVRRGESQGVRIPGTVRFVLPNRISRGAVFMLAAAMLGGGAAVATENAPGPTLANGSFETNSTDGGSTYQPLYEGFAGLPGWRFSAAPSPVLIGTPDESYPYATPFGRWQVDLSGSNNTGGGWIETDVTGLDAGQDCRITFAIGVSTAFVVDVGAPALRVTAGGATADFTVQPAGIIQWVPRAVEFRATAATAVVRFTNISPNGTGFIAVDNVTVTAVSAPPSVRLEPLADGGIRVQFTGQLQSSPNLRDWVVESEVTSGVVLKADSTQRFYRAVAD